MLTVIVAFFAAYGLGMLVWQVWRRAARRGPWIPVAVVVVTQANDWIEWFVRKLSLESYATGRDVADILIVDTSASLETSMIVSMLQRSCPFVTYVPSSPERRWSDVAALLGTGRRRQALLLEVSDENDVNIAIRLIEHFPPS